MSRGRSVVRGGVLSGASIFVSTLAMLAVGKMFTNVLDQAGVAIFTLLLLWADFINIAGNLGLAVSLPKLIGAAPEDRRAAISGACLSFQHLLLILLAIVCWAVPAVLWQFRVGPASWQGVYPWLLFLPPLFGVGIVRDTSMAALAGFNRYGPRAMGIVTSSAAQVLFVFLFIWVLKGGVAALSITTTAAYAVAVAWLLAALPRGARWHPDFALARECVRFSMPLYVNSLLTFVFQRFDTMFLLLVLQSPAAVALYEMAKRLPVLVSRFLGALAVPFLPTISEMIARNERGEAARFLTHTSSILAFFGYLTALMTILVQEPLLILLFNRDYLAATSVLGLLMAAIAVAVQAGLMGQTLIALGKPGLVTAINVATAAFSIAANLVLLPLLGITGAGLAALCAAAFSCAAQTACVRRRGLGVQTRHLLKPHGIMLAAGLLLWAGQGGIPWRIAAVGLFVCGCLALRVVTVHDVRGLIRALLPARRS